MTKRDQNGVEGKVQHNPRCGWSGLLNHYEVQRGQRSCPSRPDQYHFFTPYQYPIPIPIFDEALTIPNTNIHVFFANTPAEMIQRGILNYIQEVS